MPEPYLGEIRMFGGNFAPQDWAFCDGQVLAISEYDALFSLIGTTYGGDGAQTFSLPDLRGRIPLHQGGGMSLGSSGGVEQVTLTTQQLPAHSHALTAELTPGNQNSPAGSVLAETPGGVKPYIEDAASVSMAANAIGFVGGGQPHENIQPYQCISFIIALAGIYPSGG